MEVMGVRVAGQSLAVKEGPAETGLSGRERAVAVVEAAVLTGPEARADTAVGTSLIAEELVRMAGPEAAYPRHSEEQGEQEPAATMRLRAMAAMAGPLTVD